MTSVSFKNLRVTQFIEFGKPPRKPPDAELIHSFLPSPVLMLENILGTCFHVDKPCHQLADATHVSMLHFACFDDTVSVSLHVFI